MADANCHKVLMKALDFDEAGDKVRFKKTFVKDESSKAIKIF